MKKQQIKEINIIKIISSIFVIFIHIEFPGMFGKCVSDIAQYAVLLFFMIAGFFTNIESPFSTYFRRIKKVVVLFMISSASYVLYDLIFGGRTISDYITIRGFVRLLLINDTNWIQYHLWFLVALVYTYLAVFLLYAVLRNRIYFLIMGLLAVWPIGYGVVHAVMGISIDYIFYRNFLFFGIPAFLIGNFVRINESVIKEKIRLDVLLMLSCAVVIVEVFLRINSLGFYGCGHIALSLLVLLICVYYKNNPIKSDIPVPDDISLYVYLIHPMIITIIEKLQIVTVPYLKPIIVAVISVVVACLMQKIRINDKS